jgi:hypothetical protein
VLYIYIPQVSCALYVLGEKKNTIFESDEAIHATNKKESHPGQKIVLFRKIKKFIHVGCLYQRIQL